MKRGLTVAGRQRGLRGLRGRRGWRRRRWRSGRRTGGGRSRGRRRHGSGRAGRNGYARHARRWRLVRGVTLRVSGPPRVTRGRRVSMGMRRRRGGGRRQPRDHRRGLRGQADAGGRELARAPGYGGRGHDAEHRDGGPQHRSAAQDQVKLLGSGLSAGKAGRSPGCAAGSDRVAIAPPPSRFSSVTSPPHPRASSRAIASPRPLPGGPATPARPR